MKLIVATLGLFAAMLSMASTPVNVVPDAGFEYSFNRFAGGLGYKYSLGKVVRQSHNTAVGVYDFAQQGGGVAGLSTSYDTGIHLPSKAVIRFVFFDTPTALVNTLGRIQVGFQAESAVDLKSLTTYSTWTGRQAGVPDGTVGTMVKLTTARSVYAIVSSASNGTLTAGKIKIFVDYVVSE